jgi:hypothetical protein
MTRILVKKHKIYCERANSGTRIYLLGTAGAILGILNFFHDSIPLPADAPDADGHFNVYFPNYKFTWITNMLEKYKVHFLYDATNPGFLNGIEADSK